MKKLFLFSIFLTFLLTSCTISEPTQPAAAVMGSKDNAMTELAEVLGIDHEDYPEIDGSTSTLSIVRAVNRALYENSENDNYPETASKTVPSYNLLIEGAVDMIIVPYASKDVLEYADKNNVKLLFYPVAAEALIFITPIENETENITAEQVREIYLNYGIINWTELGGPDRELVPICRNADSGSQSQIDNLILNNESMHPDIKKNHVELTMEGMLEQTAFYHGGGLSGRPTESYALGYTLYTYLKNIGEITGIDERLKMLAFEGIEPSVKTIADGTYPLADAYYVVLRDDLPEDHAAFKIVNWLLSDEGKEIIINLKLIPLE